MNYLQEIFDKVQEAARNTTPDPKEFMDSSLDRSTLDETMQQFIEIPQENAR